MKLLIPLEEAKKLHWLTLVPLECEYCGKTFFRIRKRLSDALSHKQNAKLHYCSHQCRTDARRTTKILPCENCGKPSPKLPSQIKPNKRNFCSQSCAGTYNNKHKTTGYRRSKLEFWLETKLKEIFPELNISYNDRESVGLELDVYIPSLKLAFELNGIFHYEPIYGDKQLLKIKDRDDRKFQSCLSKEIELCIIDVSQFKYFKEKNAQKYLDIIVNIINKKVPSLARDDTT